MFSPHASRCEPAFFLVNLLEKRKTAILAQGSRALVTGQQAVPFRHRPDVISGRATQNIELSTLERCRRLARRNDFLTAKILDLNDAFTVGIGFGDEGPEVGLGQNIGLLQGGYRIECPLRRKCR